ncbi:cation efflux protein [Delitschia confertaspora ATCC 74209]|uniref:Cation efflux protein n=1 Tax=Delitschia confertaspora ATCC 74209 TaxID=1513339 RepID=A0A9P4JIT3_9PLEO|nr:cation efflux protein [Delitschia confertaspora ATCC 74209]
MPFHFKLSRKQSLKAVIVISFTFFVAEISTGFYTKSLALIADAFHYLNDLIGFIVALVAVQVTERKTFPQDLSFGWARAQLLGAFFNGAFLLALGLSIALQSVERFISIQRIEQPKTVLIVGCVGLTLNIISAAFLHGKIHQHEHAHAHDDRSFSSEIPLEANARARGGGMELQVQHAEHMHLTVPIKTSTMDLGILGVLIHVVGDAINNIGVIIAALIIWFTKSEGRFYADPAVSMWIAIMILASAIPLTKRSGAILLQSAPPGVRLEDVKHDMESIPGVLSVHELHVWRLDQRKSIATAHVIVKDESLSAFMQKAQTVSECLHAYGIHSTTLQPELAPFEDEDSRTSSEMEGLRQRRVSLLKCGLSCGTFCEPLMCCNEKPLE